MAEKIDAKTGEYRAGAPAEVSAAITPLSPSTLAALEGMTRDELILLCRRFACQCGTAAMMTKEETAQAMRDVLAETALKPIAPGLNMRADIAARVTAIDKWLDREEGKPVQRQVVAATVESHVTVSQEERMKRADDTADEMMRRMLERVK